VRPLPDFTEVAARSVENALAHVSTASTHERRTGSRVSVDALRMPPRPEDLLQVLFEGTSLKRAARAVGVNRSVAKRICYDAAMACMMFHRAVLVRARPRRLVYRASWALTAKRRGAPTPRSDDLTANAVWTHLCIDEQTGVAPLWGIGPPLSSTEQALVTTAQRLWPNTPVLRPGDATIDGAAHGVDGFDEWGVLQPWLKTRDPGFARRVRQHAWAVTLWVVRHNFCGGPQTNLATPAMRAGLTSRRLTAKDILTGIPRRIDETHGPA
jgi:hypothetical protein